LNNVHFCNTYVNIVQISLEEDTMQTIVSEIALTFVDDAAALVTGFAGIVRNMAVETFTAARKRVLAPVDRLARACDVGGVIAAREAGTTRSRHGSANWQRAPAPRRWRDRLNIFRGLHDLT
jgi:FAD/FMN-containing dehydrogenase